ncbi:MAG TPA: PAS domain S-box protein [Acetobacteraceae bacterium]|nr:PAS domain S-box protein [Acetobacteraceae bacterium]
MSGPEETDSEIAVLRQRLAALEAQTARLGQAQVMTRDLSGEIRFWSSGMERLYGYTAAEAVGRVSHNLLRTEFPLSLHTIEHELLEREQWTGELHHRRRDGREVVVISHQSLLRGDTPLVTEANNDITEERRGREARLYLASIVESSDDAIIGKTLEGVVTSWNRAAAAIFGYRSEEIIGQPVTLLHPSYLLHEEAMILERLRSGERISHYETTRLRKDGSEIAVTLTISPIRNPSGQIIGASKIVRDVTSERRNQSRIEELQAELVHVSRLSTMGQMASAIAHELNQPLTAVSNYAGALGRMLATGNADQARAHDIVERIRAQAGRAGDVIRRLRDHVAKRAATRHLEDVNATVSEAVELGLIGMRHQNVRTELRLDPAVGLAPIDRVQIGQVVINLVRNALEAMQEREPRELTVATRPDHGMVEIIVSDTGPGLSSDVAERLFQAFVTTKASGLGLGLSICREIVEAHEGRITAAANPAGGTIFTVALPRSSGAADRDPAAR